MCESSCQRDLGVVFSLLATAAALIHFSVPFWITTYDGMDVGLWFACPDNSTSIGDCKTFIPYYTGFDPKLALMYASQSLSVLAVVLLIISLVFGCGTLCCCKSKGYHRFIGCVLIIAGFLLVGSMGVWAYFNYDFTEAIPFKASEFAEYTWGYYLGMGGVLAAWLSGTLFFCSAASIDKSIYY